MRGKVLVLGGAISSNRITPAYAGKSPTVNAADVVNWGSPPPMRGKEFRPSEDVFTTRITPAYAGKRQIAVGTAVLN